jgi:hypothetical protein
MSISSNELADIVLRTKAGALPGEASRLQIMVDATRHSNITARLDRPEGSAAANTVAQIVESQAQGFRNLAERRAVNGNDIRFRIHETMPINLAHRFVRDIKERVMRETGLLEAGD